MSLSDCLVVVGVVIQGVEVTNSVPEDNGYYCDR